MPGQVLDVKTKEYEVARHSLFFNDTDARKIYKEYVKAIITRVNSVNGRRYSEDPTLMSWGLLNEPRCETWLVSNLLLSLFIPDLFIVALLMGLQIWVRLATPNPIYF